MIFAIVQTLYIWIIFLVLSFVFYPVAKAYFSKSFDKGWIAAKVISLLIISYTAYLIGILKIFKFSTLELWLILGFFFVLIRFISWKRNKTDNKVIIIDTRLVVVDLNNHGLLNVETKIKAIKIRNITSNNFNKIQDVAKVAKVKIIVRCEISIFSGKVFIIYYYTNLKRQFEYHSVLCRCFDC